MAKNCINKFINKAKFEFISTNIHLLLNYNERGIDIVVLTVIVSILLIKRGEMLQTYGNCS